MPLEVVAGVRLASATTRTGDLDHVVIGEAEQSNQPGVAPLSFDHIG